MKTTRPAWLTGIALALALSACSKSDLGITTAVKTKMIADPVVRAYKIEVATDGGKVTLTGNIDSFDAKERALAIASQTAGVVTVRDMIEVWRASGSGAAPSPGRSIGTTIDDMVITMRVKGRILEDGALEGSRIDVDTRAGVVFLTGDVETPKAKEQAIKIARAVDGVRDVQANLRVSAV
jgi:hyperosmotically inducible protein